MSLFTEHDLNYIELFLASDIKLARYQAKGLEQDPTRVHNLIQQAINGMIYKLGNFLEKHLVGGPYYA